MTRILLLATTTGYQIRSFGEAAGKLGVGLLLASDRCDQLDDPWWDGAVPVRFHDPAASVRAVLAACAGNQPTGVLAVGDRPAVLAAHVATVLGLPGNTPAAAEASRNKLAARQAFARAGLLTPAFTVFPIEEASSTWPDVEYPAVLKPLALSGSRGVMRVDTRHELLTAGARLGRLLRSPDVVGERDAAHSQALLEAFIPGREYAVEGVLTAGAFKLFTIFDKPDPLDGPFFEETMYVSPSTASSDVQQAIVHCVSAAARALGLTHGAIHAECRVNDRGVYMLEVAPRPIGGLCARALRLEGPRAVAATLEEVLLRQAVGEDISGYRLAPGASGVMMIPIPRRGVYRGVRGVDEAERVPGIEEVRITAKLDARLGPLPEGHSYLGFIFARASTPAAVEQALCDAHAALEFAFDRDLSVE